MRCSKRTVYRALAA
nr:hypothetical protein [Mycobacteroides abscessus]